MNLKVLIKSAVHVNCRNFTLTTFFPANQKFPGINMKVVVKKIDVKKTGAVDSVECVSKKNMFSNLVL